MAMTVLPSFQTFLQSAAQAPRPLSPLYVQQPQSPVLAHQQPPHFRFELSPSGYQSPPSADVRTAAILDGRFAPVVWKTSGPPSSSHGATSSEEDIDDEDDFEELQQDQQLLQRARAHAESFVYRHRAVSPRPRYASPVATSLAAAGPRAAGAAAASSADASSPTAAKRVKKKYLKERERCEIVRRVRAGEKQAHLAKEFGVSRAAVCYLLKHQMEILRRSAQRL